MNKIQKYLKLLQKTLAHADRNEQIQNTQTVMMGRLLSETVRTKKQIQSLREVEFKVFSQFGDDGIIQWLIHNLELPNDTFIEFGVENYNEANTRFLLLNDNWSGLIMDGSESNIWQIRANDYYSLTDLQANAVFITAENINGLITAAGFNREVGILHIDIDGNDYWVWKAIDVILPIIVIMEYNSVFGVDRAITIPYQKDFYRTTAHFSNLYFGASLPALYQLSQEKGYDFIGCNSAGNNAYFVRKDKINHVVRSVSLETGCVVSKFRESRNQERHMTQLTGPQRLEAIRGLPVYNVETDQMETL